MLPVPFTVWLGLLLYFVLLSRTPFCGTLRGVAIDNIVHICDGYQWILNQPADPLEVECVQRTRGSSSLYIWMLLSRNQHLHFCPRYHMHSWRPS